MEPYYRRSRRGCINCREARIKCDEAQPACQKCQGKGINCSGYAKVLKWVAETPTHRRASSALDDTNRVVLVRRRPADAPEAYRAPAAAPSSSKATLHAPPQAMHRTPTCRHQSSIVKVVPSQPFFTSDRDVVFFQYWWQVVPALAFPNPKKYARLLEQHKAMVLEFGHILLPMIFACAAGHLASSGFTSETEVLTLKQLAVESMIKTLRAKPQGRTRRHVPTLPEPCIKPLGLPFDELGATLSASLQLIGIEILHGSDLGSLLPLLRGAVFLVENLRIASRVGTEKRSGRYPAVIDLEIRLLAYHDLMTCIPLPRKPYLRREHWETARALNETATDHGSNEPDIIFGFGGTIIPLIGECATIVERLFEGRSGVDEFACGRSFLLNRLEEASEKLPMPFYVAQPPTESSSAPHIEEARLQSHNASVCVARCHGLASQIFLLRATDFDGSSLAVLELSSKLEAEVREVPADNPAVTIMLWPLWVLGCESLDGEVGRVRRELVAELLRRMLARESFLNIKRCLETLEGVIWSLRARPDAMAGANCGKIQVSSHCDAAEELENLYGRHAWVRICFERRICPVLA